MAAPSSTTAITGLGTSSVQVLAAAASTRSKVRFHNCNATNSVIVCQATDSSGNALAATFTSPAGGFVILAGGSETFTGKIQGAWNAAASAGGSNTLTIWEELGPP